MKFIVALFLFVSCLSFSQTTTLKVRESSEFKDEVKSDAVLAIYTSENNITGIVRNSKRDLMFDAFDASLNKVFSKIVESSKKEEYVGDVFFGDVVKVFTVFAPSKSERTIFCHNFNIQSKSYNKVEVFSTTVEKNQSLFSGGNKRQTSFSLSPNGKYLAIITDDIKKNLNSYTARVFESSSLKLVYETAYQEDKEKYFEPNDMVVNNEGTVFSLGKKFIKGRSEKKKGEANYDFVLNKITKDNTSDLVINLDKAEHIRSLNISLNNDELRMMGFFSERNVNRIKGGCNIVIDVSDQLVITEKKTFDLPLSVYEDLYGDIRADKKKDTELSNFYVDYFIADSEGNTYVLAEEFYITQQYIANGNMGGASVTTYHYDDVLILKFNADNELEWGRSIFKRSTSPSYNAFLKNDKLHVILNSGKNLVEKEDGRTKVSKGFLESTSLYDIVFSADGSDSYDKIQDNKGNTDYIPFYGTFRNDTFIMMSSGRTNKQFMILE